MPNVKSQSGVEEQDNCTFQGERSNCQETLTGTAEDEKLGSPIVDALAAFIKEQEEQAAGRTDGITPKVFITSCDRNMDFKTLVAIGIAAGAIVEKMILNGGFLA